MVKKLKIFFLRRKCMCCFTAFLLFICCSQQGRAQSNSEDSASGSKSSVISFGAKVGAVVSHFTDQQPYTNESLGFAGGLFGNYGFSDHFSIQLEANYVQQGGRINRFDVPSFYGFNDLYALKMENQKIRMHNIEVPLLAQYSLPLSKGKININLGPAFSYNISTGIDKEGTIFASGSDEFHTYTGEENISSVINDYEFSAIGGIGFEFEAFDGMAMIVDVRYKYGLTDVYEGYSYVGIPQIRGDLRNNSMYFTLGVKF